MSEFDYIEENNTSPIISIAIGSFDLLSGTRLCNVWVFSKKEENFTENLENSLKSTLSTVHRQMDPNNVYLFANIPTSTVDIQCLGWYITNAIFTHASSVNAINPAAKRDTFYSVIFIFKSFLIRNDYHLRRSLLSLTRKFAESAKTCLANNQPLSSLKEYADDCRRLATSLIESGIPTSFYVQNKEFGLPCTDLYFYSSLLTSHIQTKMTTVIETTSLSEAFKIVSFLINFMFPFQIGQSSIQHALTPVPGLFLQIVEKQKRNILDIVSEFNGPVTWLKLFESREIYLFNSTTKSKTTSNSNPPSLESYEIFNDNPSKEIKIFSSNWSLATCYQLLSSQSKTESKTICKEQFSELTRNSLFFLTMENKKNEKEMFKKMMQIDEQDEKALNAVSQLLQIKNASE